MANKQSNNSQKQNVCVIGLGYVGFAVACLAAHRGYRVLGFDTDPNKIKRIQDGENVSEEPFLTDIIPKIKLEIIQEPKQISQAEIYIIAVPTPVDEKYYPILEPIIKASEMIAQNMRPEALVILESTVNPGVSEEVVKPIFEKAGWKVGQDVFIAHCPERVNPGDPDWNVSNIPRVIGSFEKEGLKKAQEFYESIIDAKITPMSSIREAEAVKIVENSFRDINIAFVNELAKSFNLMNIDITNVIKGAATKPYAFMPHWPSCGVGGHCIPVDPYYLIEKAKDHEFDHKFLRAARNINNSMPLYAIELLKNALNEVEKPLKNTPVGILGISYKANVSDLRESPALKIIKLLKQYQPQILKFDPYLPEMNNVSSVDELLDKAEAIILCTDHNEFKQITPDLLKQKDIQVVIDGKNIFDKNAITKLGIIYKGIGR